MKRYVLFVILTLVFLGCSNLEKGREVEGDYSGSYKLGGLYLFDERKWLVVEDRTNSIDETYRSFNIKKDEDVFLKVHGIYKKDEGVIVVEKVLKMTPYVN